MLQTFKPKSKVLEKYIDFYYVFTSDRPNNISYLAFPHVNTAISFFKGVSITRFNFNINIEAKEENQRDCKLEILGKYTQPVFVNYLGICEEIAIVFKPLGVNHFFKNDLKNFAPHFSQALNDELWINFSIILFNTKILSEKIEMLELFLEKNLIQQPFERLYQAICYLEDFQSNYTIEKIASLCGFNLKTFQRNFMKHLTCSPSEYKRIARFRHSMANKLISKELMSLTNISYESNYYDQSYFVKEYKKLTELNPKSFFESITDLNEKKIIWQVK